MTLSGGDESLQPILEANRPNLTALCKAIREKSIILFIGAGMSAPSGKPTWYGFVKGVVDTLISNHLLSADEETRARELLESRQLPDLLDEFYPKHPRIFENKIRDDFAALDRSLIRGAILRAVTIPRCTRFMTTNLDTVLETLLPTQAVIFPKNAEDHERARQGNHFILKLHGTVDKSSTWVLTSDQYRQSYGDEEFRDLLRDLFTNNAVLFLGCSLEKDRITDEFRKVARDKKHAYAIVAELPDPDRTSSRAKHLSELGIVPIWLTNARGSRDADVYETHLENLLSFIASSTEEPNVAYDPFLNDFLGQVCKGVQFLNEGASEIRRSISDLSQHVDAACVRLFLNHNGKHINIDQFEVNRGHLAPAIQLSPRSPGLASWVYRTGQRAYFPGDDQFRHLYAQTDTEITRELLVPLRIRNFVVGVLLVDWTIPTRDDYWATDVGEATIKSVSKTAAEISRVLLVQNGAKYLSKTCERHAERCVRETHSERGNIALWTPHGDLDSFSYGQGSDGFLPIYPTEGLCGKTLRTGQVQNVPMLSQNDEAIVSSHELQSELVIPILKEHVVIGIVNVERKEGAYTAADEEILEKAAADIADKFTIPVEDVLKTSTILLLSAPTLQRDQVLEILKGYIRTLLKRAFRVTDIEVHDRQPHPHENGSDPDLTDRLCLMLNYRGKPHTVVEARYPGNQSPGKGALDSIRMCRVLAANALARERTASAYHLLARLAVDGTSPRSRRTTSAIQEELFRKLDEVVHGTRRLVESSQATLFWASPEDDDLLVPGASTSARLFIRDPSIAGYRKGTPYQGFTGQVFSTGAALNIKDLRTARAGEEFSTDLWPDLLVTETKKDSCRSFIACPISDGSRTLGVLRAILEVSEPKPSFTATDLELLRAVAAAALPLVKDARRHDLRSHLTLVPIHPSA